MTPDTSGPTSRRQFAFYDPDSSCWRMWPAISLWGSEPYSETWPKRGTTRNGSAYELPTSAPPMDVPESSSLLPTPLASDGEKGGPNQRGGSGDLRLSSAVQNCAQPAATTPTSTTLPGSALAVAAGTAPTQHGDAPRLLPTPTTSSATGPGEHGDGGDNL